jgi:hypothetical protein
VNVSSSNIRPRFNRCDYWQWQHHPIATLAMLAMSTFDVRGDADHVGSGNIDLSRRWKYWQCHIDQRGGGGNIGSGNTGPIARRAMLAMAT